MSHHCNGGSLIVDVSESRIYQLLKIGVNLFFSGQLLEAKNCFNEVLKLDPDNAAALRNIRIVCQEQDEPKKAKADFDKAKQIDPTIGVR